MNKIFTKLADEKTIKKTMTALEKNGIESFVFETGEEAKQKLFELLPEGSEVMNMTSMTLDALGIPDVIMNSGKYISNRKKLNAMDKKTQGEEMRKLGAAPQFAIGSVHAVTENGEVLFASKTGSQLAANVYGAGKVIWIVSTKKIVRDLNMAKKRILKHCLPLENQRALKAYGVNSYIGKILTFYIEQPGRITLIFVKQDLGF